jgi:formate hydrogenlyase subunit 3/multisubunit Na+/H+ antiporter MnhD subunit
MRTGRQLLFGFPMTGAKYYVHHNKDKTSLLNNLASYLHIYNHSVRIMLLFMISHIIHHAHHHIYLIIFQTRELQFYQKHTRTIVR